MFLLLKQAHSQGPICTFQACMVICDLRKMLALIYGKNIENKYFSVLFILYYISIHLKIVFSFSKNFQAFIIVAE